MKWLAAAAGVAVAGAISLVLIGTREDPAAPSVPRRAPTVASAPAAARVTVPPPASRVEPPAGVTLQGVLLRGPHGERSQALLTVDGRQQAYAVGETVKAGWTVQAIREQQVVLANGTASTALAVAPPIQATAEQGASPAAERPATAHLPGFVAGAAAPLSDAGASERNRRFLEAVQAKARARQ